MKRIQVWVLVATLGLAACGGPLEGDDGDETSPDEIGSVRQAASKPVCGKDTWKNYAKSFFKTHCATCHANAFATQAAVQSSAAQSLIASGAMPRNKKLSASEKKKILAWFQCGAP